MTHLTIEHFSTLKQYILNEPWPTGHDGASGPCSHMASFLHDSADCVYWQWFLEVFLGPFSYVNDKIMPMSDAVSSEGIHQRSLALSLMHRDFSSFSETLMMLCTVDDEISIAFAIWHWGTLFLKYSTIFLCILSQIGEPLTIFTSERLCLSETSIFIANHVTDLKLINLISC